MTIDPTSGLDPEPVGHNRRAAQVGTEALIEHTPKLLSAGFRLALVAAHHEGDHVRIVYLFTAGPPDRRIELVVRVPADRAQIPTLAACSFPASRFEREMRDVFGIEPIDHPQPRPIVHHQHWPADYHPLRHDAPTAPRMNADNGGYPFAPVEGVGIYEIPVGPIHAGVIEPGHFRFFAVGETIVRMKARLWFVHKGIERLFQGRLAHAGVELAERISGDTAVGHSLAYCLAVEDAYGIAVPTRTQTIRSVLLELERLYNHVTDIGALCNDVGFGVINAQALRIREQLLRINETTTGHRLLRGAISPGAVGQVELPDPRSIVSIRDDLHQIVDIALGNSTVVDRFTGTGVLLQTQAHDMGVLGYVARASGETLDARIAHPLTVNLAGWLPKSRKVSGDVLARFEHRVEEFDTSVALIGHLIASLDDTSPNLDEPGQRRTGSGNGVGIVEGWRGTIVHRVELDAGGVLTRVKVVDPSFMNWPALPVALADAIVPDFPLINKSFNQSYAGNDL